MFRKMFVRVCHMITDTSDYIEYTFDPTRSHLPTDVVMDIDDNIKAGQEWISNAVHKVSRGHKVPFGVADAALLVVFVASVVIARMYVPGAGFAHVAATRQLVGRLAM